MTLSERLNDYKTRNKLSNIDISNFTGIAKCTISEILHGQHYSPFTAEKFYKAFGDDFREYFEYLTCPHCGDEYIPKTGNAKTCGKDQCVRKQRAKVNRDWWEKVKAGEIQPARRTGSHAPYILPDKKPTVTLKDFNERARSQGLSYGRLQGLERLGLR